MRKDPWWGTPTTLTELGQGPARDRTGSSDGPVERQLGDPRNRGLVGDLQHVNALLVEIVVVFLGRIPFRGLQDALRVGLQ